MADTFQDFNIDFFKFKELRVYGSTEYLADNQKKYRQVFNRSETSYIYAEITLFNKLFDENISKMKIKFTACVSQIFR